MYPYLKHQTELFVFDNDLVHNFQSDKEVVNLLMWKFDFKKTNDVITFAVLGVYEIFIQDLEGRKLEKLYKLNAGRLFEIEFYDPNEASSFKLFENGLKMVYTDLKRISKEALKKTTLKRFIFPSVNIEAFHANLHIYLSDLEE